MKQMRLMDGRCPACGEWQQLNEALLGHGSVCGNCRQVVKLIPRTSGRRKLRWVVVALLVAGGLLGTLVLWQWRVESLVRTLSGPEL
jgi:uncharacterized protein (DUF983 family)